MVSNRPDLIQPLLSLSPTKKVPSTLSPECHCSQCAWGRQSTFYVHPRFRVLPPSNINKVKSPWKFLFFRIFLSSVFSWLNAGKLTLTVLNSVSFQWLCDNTAVSLNRLFSFQLMAWRAILSCGPHSLCVANWNETSALWEIPSAKFSLYRSWKIAVCILTEHTGVSNLLRWTKQRLSLISPYRVNPGFSG